MPTNKVPSPDEIGRLAKVLDDAIPTLQELMKEYTLDIAKSSSSLPRMMLYTFVVKWHIARRLESFVRLYRATTATLGFMIEQYGATGPESAGEGAKILSNARGSLGRFSSLLTEMDQLTESLSGKALSYVTSVLLVLLTLASSFVLQFSSQTEFLSLDRNELASILLAGASLLLLLLDANLYNYIKVTTRKLSSERTIMDLEIGCYHAAVVALEPDGSKQPKKRSTLQLLPLGLIFVGTWGFALYTVGATLPLFYFPLLFMAILFALLLTAIPVLLTRYYRNLIRVLAEAP